MLVLFNQAFSNKSLLYIQCMHFIFRFVSDSNPAFIKSYCFQNTLSSFVVSQFFTFPQDVVQVSAWYSVLFTSLLCTVRIRIHVLYNKNNTMRQKALPPLSEDCTLLYIGYYLYSHYYHYYHVLRYTLVIIIDKVR